MGKDEDFLFPILVKKGAAISYEAARDQFRKGLKAAGIENIEKWASRLQALHDTFENKFDGATPTYLAI